MKRRKFIAASAMSVPLLSMFPANLSSIIRESGKSGIEKRSLGKTGEKLSMIGFGGIVVNKATTEQAAVRVKEAIDYGINYFDVAPSYGNAEEMLGPALEPYRKDVFLACKTTERKREGARLELEQSLKYLRTDHFDLYQLHAVTTLEDVDSIFGKGGAMETFVEAREEGKVRYLGFSAHSVEAAMALMDGFDFDTILFPFNYATWYAGNFGPQVMERAKEKQMGILALKAMAWRNWEEGEERTIDKTWYKPHTNKEEANEGLRFTLSHPVTAAIPPGHEDLFSMALKLASDFSPMNEDEIKAIKEKALKTEPLFRYPMQT
ncbi:MAG: aldo/keto reductase [Bacteroidia bacterium]|nr:MAG: aldo/keto reductase [Bacteroidia bacterium]